VKRQQTGATENVSLCASPMCATRAAAHLRKKFPHFCAGSVGKKVLLKTPPVAKEEIRSPLVNDVSREQVERAIDVAEPFAVDQPILPPSGGTLGFTEKPPEVLTRCLAIPRLVGAADDDVQAGPTRFVKVVVPASEERVQLLELDANGQLRSLKGTRCECADAFLESVEIHHAFGENSVD
jgi:hypothetical protein